MKNTNLPLLKFKCDDKHCQFECFVNRNNNVLTAYSTDMATMMEWPCPECRIGNLRYASTNAQFEFSLQKVDKSKPSEQQIIDSNARYIDPED